MGEDGGGWIYTHPGCYKFGGQPFLSARVVIEYLIKMDNQSTYQSIVTKCPIRDVKTETATSNDLMQMKQT